MNAIQIKSKEITSIRDDTGQHNWYRFSVLEIANVIPFPSYWNLNPYIERVNVQWHQLPKWRVFCKKMITTILKSPLGALHTCRKITKVSYPWPTFHSAHTAFNLHSNKFRDLNAVPHCYATQRAFPQYCNPNGKWTSCIWVTARIPSYTRTGENNYLTIATAPARTCWNILAPTSSY